MEWPAAAGPRPRRHLRRRNLARPRADAAGRRRATDRQGASPRGWRPGGSPGRRSSTSAPAKSLAKRVDALFRTPLGDARPNPAGQWLKALRGYETTRVWWAATDAAEEYEDALLEAFAAGVPAAATAALPDASLVLPFACRRRPGGSPRADGITGSTVEPAAPAGPPPAGDRLRRRRRPAEYTDDDLARVNDLLQRLACGEPSLQITPSQANAEGAVRRLLGEDPSRPASALGQLLRAGRIEGARQDLDGRWSIRCTRRGREERGGRAGMGREPGIDAAWIRKPA